MSFCDNIFFCQNSAARARAVFGRLNELFIWVYRAFWALSSDNQTNTKKGIQKKIGAKNENGYSDFRMQLSNPDDIASGLIVIR